MMTLQDVLDAVGTTPERYGRRAWCVWVNSTYEPWCPLAVEVAINFRDDGGARVSAAAAALGCPKEHIKAFTDWWDCPAGNTVVFYRNCLERLGYRVPPDEVLDRARKHSEENTQ